MQPNGVPATLRACRWLVEPGTEPERWQLDAVAFAAVLPAFEAQGLAPALAARLAGSAPWWQLDPSIRSRLEHARRVLGARELLLAEACRRACAALAATGTPVLVIKGQALAGSAYLEPATRERIDVDLWVPEDRFDDGAGRLEAAGFRASVAADGVWVLAERCFELPAGGAVDLHRRLVTQALLARALPFATVFERAGSYGAGPARKPDDADALLIAALHAVAHHGPEPRWLWVLDAHRLVTAAPACVEVAASRAREAGVAAILARLLQRAAHRYATPIEAARIAELAREAPRERSARLLVPMSRAARLWFDWRSLPGAAARWRHLRELVFPRHEYMRAKYPRATRWALPWLYVRRAVSGVWRAIVRG